MQRTFAVSMWLFLAMFVLGSMAMAQSKGKYVCDEPNPQSLCTADNTCPAFRPCTVDIKRTGHERRHGHSGLPQSQRQFALLREAGYHGDLAVFLEEHGLRYRLRTLFSVRSSGCDYRRISKVGFRRSQASGMLQVFRWSLCFRGHLRHVWIGCGRGHRDGKRRKFH